MAKTNLDDLDLDQLFGELRSFLQARENDPHKLQGILGRAREMEPDAYASRWIPYLIRYDLPGFWARTLEELTLYASLLPQGTPLEFIPRFEKDQNKPTPSWKEILHDEAMSWITKLTLGPRIPRPLEAMKAIVNSPHNNHLEALALRNDKSIVDASGTAILRHLTDATDFPKLRSLELRGNVPNNKALEHLLNAPLITQLEALDLRDNDLNDKQTFQALANAPMMQTLRWLRLGSTNLTDATLDRLHATPHPTLLEGLGLSRARLGAGALRSLAASDLMRTVRLLDLESMSLDAEKLNALLDGTQIQELRHLDLNHTQIGQRGAEVLAEHLESMPHLERLELGNCGLGEEGLRILLESLDRVSLKHLELWANDLGPAAATMMATSEHLRHLEFIHLGHNVLMDEGITTLVESPAFPELRTLYFGVNDEGYELRNKLTEQRRTSAGARIAFAGDEIGKISGWPRI